MKTSYIERCLSLGHTLSVHTARGKFIATMTCYSTTYPFSPIIAREVSFEGAIEALDAAICEDWSKELQNEGNV